MPHISLSEEREAQDRWSIEIDGKVYYARPVSRPTLVRWLAAIEEAGADARKQERALHGLLRAAFPAKWAYVFRTDPVLTILNLGIKRREEVLESFFGFALPSEMTAGPKTQNGMSTPSPSSEGVKLSPVGVI